MPMLHIGQNLHHVPFMEYLNRLAPLLVITDTVGSDENLPTRMGVPIIAGTGFKDDIANQNMELIVGRNQGLVPDRSGKIFPRSLIALRKDWSLILR